MIAANGDLSHKERLLVSHHEHPNVKTISVAWQAAMDKAFPKHFRILSAYLSTAATTRPPIALVESYY
jgi:uncharacterized protein YozE (UPF0346 family)